MPSSSLMDGISVAVKIGKVVFHGSTVMAKMNANHQPVFDFHHVLIPKASQFWRPWPRLICLELQSHWEQPVFLHGSSKVENSLQEQSRPLPPQSECSSEGFLDLTVEDGQRDNENCQLHNPGPHPPTPAFNLGFFPLRVFPEGRKCYIITVLSVFDVIVFCGEWWCFSFLSVIWGRTEAECKQGPRAERHVDRAAEGELGGPRGPHLETDADRDGWVCPCAAAHRCLSAFQNTSSHLLCSWIIFKCFHICFLNI